MTKEDKQIINRATKEEWRIGDRTRLKRLLEKNLKLYRENVELEKENAELKESNTYKACVKLAHQANVARDNLDKAKEIIKGLLSCCRNYPQENADKIKQAEQFIKEIEK